MITDLLLSLPTHFSCFLTYSPQVERELDMERTVFFIQHRIRIAVDNTPKMEQSWQVRVEVERMLLSRLESVLRKLYYEKRMDLERLANTTIHFGTRAGIDLIGRIGLRATDSESDWLDQLFLVDRDRIDAIKEGSAERFDIEKQFSDLIGISYVFTDYALGGSEQYRIYVRSLIEEAESQHFKLSGADSLRLRILESPNLEDVKTDNSTCTLALPIQITPKQVLETIQAQYEDLVREHAKLNRAQFEMDALILSAKRKFKLRALTWEPSITNEQLQSCATGLIRYSTQLFRFLEGQRIRVSIDYNLDQTDGTIHIRWDFMV